MQALNLPTRTVSPRGHRSLRERLARQGWIFSAPAFFIIAGITIFPILFSIFMSLNNISLTYSGFKFQWTGMSNYSLVWSNSLFQYALGFTIIYTLITVTVELILGMGVALVLHKLAYGRGFLLAILLLPWALITAISAEMWSFIYNGVYGVLNAVVMGLGLVNHLVIWLGTPVLAIASTMVADIWKTTPFVAIILFAGLQMISSEIFEAASIDGAGAWQTFWRITLPLLKPTLLVALLFRTLQAFGVFDLPFVLTGGGPGHATESLAILSYQVLFEDLSFGPGAAIATSTTLIVMAVAFVFLRVFRVQVGDSESSA